MNPNEEQSRLAASKARFRRPASGWLASVLTFVVGAALLLVAFTFSLLVLLIVVTGGLLIWGYLWWTKPQLRSRMRESSTGGRVIEGEVIRDAGPDDQDRR